jgi:hypothetical protein
MKSIIVLGRKKEVKGPGLDCYIIADFLGHMRKIKIINSNGAL